MSKLNACPKKIHNLELKLIESNNFSQRTNPTTRLFRIRLQKCIKCKMKVKAMLDHLRVIFRHLKFKIKV